MGGGEMDDGGQVHTQHRIHPLLSTSQIDKKHQVCNANANVSALLPWSVEFHQHGLVLRCQVVEVCVAELEYISARGHYGGKISRQQVRDGGKEAKSDSHDRERR